MPKPSELILHYFSFTKKERRSAIALLIIIALLAFAPLLFPLLFAQKHVQDEAFEKDVLALKEKQETNRWQDNGNESSDFYQSKNYNKPDRYAFHGTMFSFDPNTIDEAGWKKLGLRDKTIATILNFRNKGGKFYKPEDIGKIWGLHQDEYERLLPYVNITSIEKKQYPQYAKTEYEKKDFGSKSYAPQTVEINSADTNALIALPFIGSKLAYRITNFRDKLGGFVSVEQIGETWGLQDSVFQKVKTRLTCDANNIKKLNINTDDAASLKHPYIKWNIANVIVQYHKQHGNYKSVNDLLLTGAIDETLLKKIRPYLTINNE